MNKLRELRKAKGLTQEKMGKEVDVSKLTVINWEKETHQIKPDKAQQLAEYFGVSVGYLLGYEPEGMPKRSIYEEVYSALLRVKSENPNHDDRVAIREVCMELIEATLEGY